VVQVTDNPASVCDVSILAPESFQKSSSRCTVVGGISHGSAVLNEVGLVSYQPGTLPYTGTLEFMVKMAEKLRRRGRRWPCFGA
jgi:hypothetical protein